MKKQIRVGIMAAAVLWTSPALAQTQFGGPENLIEPNVIADRDIFTADTFFSVPVLATVANRGSTIIFATLDTQRGSSQSRILLPGEGAALEVPTDRVFRIQCVGVAEPLPCQGTVVLTPLKARDMPPQ